MGEPILYQDTFEPDEMLSLLQQSVTALVGPLNFTGRADYFWLDRDGNRRQWERKQAGEALGDLDAVEEQLNRELSTCEELTLVMEGVFLPTPRGVQIYRLSRDRTFFHPYTELPRKGRKAQPGLWARWHGLKRGLIAAGVDVVETTCLEGTAASLVAAFKSSHKPKHTTLRRYVRPHVPPFDVDRHVDNLARLKGTGIGVEKAKKLKARCGSVYGAVTADWRVLKEVLGAKGAKGFMEGVGREDIP
jgi:hypothetical protein